MSLKVLLYLKKAGDQDSSILSWHIIPRGKAASMINGDIALIGNGSFSDFIRFYHSLFSVGISGKQKSKQLEIIGILPGSSVTYVSVVAPTKNRRQTMQAIPFLVEEYVIGELDDMHIGIGPHTKEQKIRVAIVEKKIIKKWSDLFEGNKIPLTTIVSLPDLLPVENNEAKIVFFDNEVIFKSNNFCIQISEDNLKNIFPVIPVEGINLISIFCNPREKNSSQLSRKIKIEIESEGLAKVEIKDLSGPIFDNDALFLDYSLTKTINLLETKYAGGFGYYADFFIPVGASIILLAFIQISLNVVSGLYFLKRSDFVIENAKDHYQELFETSSVTDVKKQWESRLKSSLVFSADRSFSAIFPVVMNQFLAKKNENGVFKLEEFRFDSDSGDLKINIQIDSVASLDSLKASLKEKAVGMEIISANNDNGAIKASIVVKSL